MMKTPIALIAAAWLTCPNALPDKIICDFATTPPEVIFTSLSPDKQLIVPESGGPKTFAVKGYAILRSKDKIPIEPQKTYLLQGEFKSDGAYPSNLYLGFELFDENGTVIQAHEINPIPGTETILAAPCAPDDTILKLSDCEKWNITSTMELAGYVAYDVDDTGKYPDLPYRKCIGRGIETKKQNGATWDLTMKSKCGIALPAGTKVRAQCGGGYMYTAAAGVKVPTAWTTYEGYACGVSDFGVTADKFWRGTKSVKIYLLANYNQQKEWGLSMKNIKLTESSKAPPKKKTPKKKK